MAMPTTSVATPSSPSAERETARGVVLYDGQCPLCLLSVKWLKRLNWLGLLQFQDAHDRDHWPTCQQPLDMSRLLEEMHVVPSNRRRHYAGFAAFRWMAWRMPLTWPLAPLLYIPGVPWLGRKVYHWVAKNRYQLVPCHDGVCKLPPRPSKG